MLVWYFFQIPLSRSFCLDIPFMAHLSHALRLCPIVRAHLHVGLHARLALLCTDYRHQVLCHGFRDWVFLSFWFIFLF